MFTCTDCVCSHVQTVCVHAYRLYVHTYRLCMFTRTDCVCSRAHYRLCMFTRTLQTVYVHAYRLCMFTRTDCVCLHVQTVYVHVYRLCMFSRTDCVCSHVQTVYVHAYRLCMFTRTLQTVHVHATDCAAEPAPQPCLQRPDTHTGHELHPICMRRLGCCMRPSANALPSVKLLSVPTGQGRELLCFLDVGNAFRVLGYRMRAHTLLRLRVPTECCDLA